MTIAQEKNPPVKLPNEPAITPQIVAEHGLAGRCDVLFSPSKSELAPRELADWIVADRLPVRFQMQLHKLLWNDEPGR